MRTASGRPRSQCGGVHLLAAGRADPRQLERAAVAVEQQAAVLGPHAAAGRSDRVAVHARLDHAHELAARQRQPRADVRAQRAHLPLDRLG